VGIEDPLDLYSLGRIHNKFGNYPESIRCYQRALAGELSEDWRSTISLSLAYVYKRAGWWDKASEIWQKLVGGTASFQPSIYEELAKYFEHRIREYQQALLWVEKAMSLISSGYYANDDSNPLFRYSRSGEIASWQYRKARLLRKLERSQARHQKQA
jgi:tetratricopeptide (TPR) repeat protein